METDQPNLKLDPVPDAVPGHRVGRYKLLEKIGERGFGEVWMAEQREPVKRRVALKFIKLGMDTRQIVARFEAERQALAMMDHPDIAKIFDGVGAAARPSRRSLVGGHVAGRAHAGVRFQGRHDDAFSPDGKTLATAADDRKGKLWNIATEQEVATLVVDGGCRSVKFSPDGRTLAVGYVIEPEQRIRLWEVPSFEDIDEAEAKEKAEINEP